MRLEILGIPKPKQSARFRSIKVGEKTFMKSYQKKEVVENERNIRFDIKSQLPADFVPYDCALEVDVIFIFPVPSNFTKKNQALLNEGHVFYKPTKPDLTDNLMKGLFDAMNGLVFTDDSRICKVSSVKILGNTPKIILHISELTK
jgi:Holliday junction resolvase RusA-like endonuclease